MIAPTFARIVIDPEVADSPISRAILRNSGSIEVTFEPTRELADGTRHLSLTAGKRLLLVRRFLGRSVKLCQGWKTNYACCNLHTVAEANNCSMECTYCILQFYMTSPHITVFGNIDALADEIHARTSEAPERLFRIGTGELSDSLLLDPLTESTTHMVPFFRELPNAVLELKTKTDNIDRLLELDAGERTVVSWSVNPVAVVERDELKTASLSARLRAASRVAEHGYPVGFHLDPMVRYREWRSGYSELIDAIFGAVSLNRIAWISLGSLRFPPEMKHTMAERFPRSDLRTGELVPAADGKLHYLRPTRIEMYRHVAAAIRAKVGTAGDRGPVVYLCMEPPDVWKRVFDTRPPTNAELEYSFAENYSRRFERARLRPPERHRYEEFAATTARAQAGSFVPSSSIGRWSSATNARAPEAAPRADERKERRTGVEARSAGR